MSELVLKNEKENLPKGWIYCILEDIANEVNSGFPSGKHNKEQKGIPHIRPMNIDYNGNIDLSVVKYVENNTYDHLRKGDVLFNNTNSPKLLGKTALIKQDTNWAYSNHMTRIRFNTSLIEPKWMAYFLHKLFWEGYYKIRATNHVNQSSINSTYLSKQIPILLAPLNEQKRIVDKIEESFSLIDSTKQLLEKTKILLKQYRQSLLKSAFEGKLVPQDPNDEPVSVLSEKIRREKESKSKMNFGMSELVLEKNSILPKNWVNVKLDDISEIMTGNTPNKKNPKFYGGNIFYFKPTDLNNGFNVINSVDKLSELGLKHARKIPEKSILVTCIGATIGKTGFIRTSGATNQQINSLIPNSSMIIPELLYYWCISPPFQESILKNSSSTTLPIINKSKFSKLVILLPPLNEQKRIVAKIEESFSLIQNSEKLVDLLLLQNNSMKNSILKQAFEGKLVPQDPNDESAEILLQKIKQEKQKMSQTKRGKKNDK